MRKAKVTKMAKALGVSLDLTINQDQYDADMWAPSGKKMGSTQAHCAVVHFVDGPETGTLAEFYRAVAKELEDGLIDCEEADCEVCEG